MDGLLPGDSTYRVQPSEYNHGNMKADKLVLVVIDGLRSDLLLSPKYSIYWSELYSAMHHPSAVCSISHVQPPTVTLPRIKAITSGRAPKFIDVLRNLDAKSSREDTWVHYLFQHKWVLNFLGDETWLKLFPQVFDFHDATSSFFVNDFSEVDNNVTRHLPHLVNGSQKWDALIIHFLGLDHIGHVEGPFGPSVSAKLNEMDKVLGYILNSLAIME